MAGFCEETGARFVRMTLSLIGNVTPSRRSFLWSLLRALFKYRSVNGAESVRIRPSVPPIPGKVSLTVALASPRTSSIVGKPLCVKVGNHSHLNYNPGLVSLLENRVIL